MSSTLAGIDRESVEQMVGQLAIAKENLRRLIQQRHGEPVAGERRYG